ncbi:cation diffusion facilitator family transporter [Streptomyces sp. NBC_01803]|uniref:cation diffusion facilitator family transporter n=1 Tax=Streptomyces sp. NBC_01803 TaxID=2975946 RepID=UPI002DDC3FC4|nr:cation diffusion facilitator family transporter [Streptomyces sp. NBC_01803]WSA43364.1 cation diffusion facilitator family transporter [Streptomyces sp. NBC_01803]
MSADQHPHPHPHPHAEGHDGHGHPHADHEHPHADQGHAHGEHEHPHGEHPHGDHEHPHADQGHAHGEHEHPHGEHPHGEHGHGHAHGGHGHDHGEHGHDHPGGLRGFLLEIFRPHSHDAADSTDDALESSAEGIRALKISLVALMVTALLQVVVVVISGSVALLADTIHNFSDALTALPLWFAFALSARAASRRYTYGYGRSEDLAGIFIVLMIATSAVVAGWESVDRLLDPRDLDNVWLVAAAGAIGFIGNELVAKYRISVGRRIGSAALVADGLHARTDGFTSLAVVFGALGVWLGFPLADPIVGLLVTVMILMVLRGAARDIFRRLMDAVDPDAVTAAEETISRVPGVVEVEAFRMRWIGHRLHGEAAIAVDCGSTVVEGHDIAQEVRHRLLHSVPKLEDVMVHVSPCSHEDHDYHARSAHHFQRAS